MGFRLSSKTTKGRFFFYCLFIIVILSLFYSYLMYAQDNFNSAKSSERRCLTELSSVKYQLNVITDHKSSVEKMLTESQNAHNIDKDKFKDVAESCLTMKQQSLLCQSQFDDLQDECKKVRESYNKAKLDLEQLKIQLHNESQEKDKMKFTIHKLYSEIENLRKSRNDMPNAQEENLQSSDFFGEAKPRGLNIDFTQQKEISPGEYVVGRKNYTASEAADNTVAERTILKVDNIEKRQSSTKTEAIVNQLPPGFAPVLNVVESADIANLQKPPESNNIIVDPEKPKSFGSDGAKDSNDINRDMEVVGAMPEAKERGEANEGLNVPLEQDDRPGAPGDAVHVDEQANPAAQGDDDEGEEYAVN